jgi:hypothetical protein
MRMSLREWEVAKEQGPGGVYLNCGLERTSCQPKVASFRVPLVYDALALPSG